MSMSNFKSSTPNTDQLQADSHQAFAAGMPGMKTILSQLMEALTTGGIHAQIPLISRMLEQGKSGLATSLTDTQNDLGRYGLAKSPFGQGVLANARIAGEQNIANIGPSMAQKFIEMFGGAPQGLVNSGVSGESAAASAQSGVAQSANQGYASILSAAIPKTSFNANFGK